MAISYYREDDLSSIELIISSLSEKPKSSIWFEPFEGSYTSDDLRRVCSVVEPMRCAFLASRDFVGINQGSAADLFSASLFDKENNIALHGGLDYPLFNRKTQIASGWVSSSTDVIFNKLAHADNLSRLREFIIVAFLPDDRQKLKSWSQTAIGPFWLWLNSDHIASAAKPSLRSQTVWLSYIDMTIDLGGVSMLEWIDSDCRRGITLFGHSAMIDSIVKRIGEQSHFVESPGIVKKLLGRGFSFQLVG